MDIVLKTFTEERMLQLGIQTKMDLAKAMGLEKYTFDFSLPQGWLDNFVKKHKDLTYDEVLSSTFYVYSEEHRFGVPISGRAKVQSYLKQFQDMCDIIVEDAKYDGPPEIEYDYDEGHVSVIVINPGEGRWEVANTTQCGVHLAGFGYENMLYIMTSSMQNEITHCIVLHWQIDGRIQFLQNDCKWGQETNTINELIERILNTD